MIKFDELEQRGYIYTIKNLITNKYYVGQTRLQNPVNRWKDHVDEALYKNNQSHLYASIRKYGVENFVFQIVESNILLEQLDDKEKEYIKKYDSFKNGYNNTIGGQDIFSYGKLTKEQVFDIINQIQENKRSFVEIAKDFEVNPSTISDINNGDTWHFDNIKYPIVNRCNKRYFSEAQIQDIYNELKNGKTLASIAKKYNTSKETISKINRGTTYNHSGVIYPISTNNKISFKQLEINEINEIIYLLSNTNLSYTQIGTRIHTSRAVVSSINNGKSYKKVLQQLGIIEFPIRKK